MITKMMMQNKCIIFFLIRNKSTSYNNQETQKNKIPKLCAKYKKIIVYNSKVIIKTKSRYFSTKNGEKNNLFSYPFHIEIILNYVIIKEY